MECGWKLFVSLLEESAWTVYTEGVIDGFALVKGLRSDDLDFSSLRSPFLTSLRSHFPFRIVGFLRIFSTQEEMYADKGDVYA